MAGGRCAAQQIETGFEPSWFTRAMALFTDALWGPSSAQGLLKTFWLCTQETLLGGTTLFRVPHCGKTALPVRLPAVD